MGDQKFTKGEMGTYEVTPDLASRVPSLNVGDELVFLPLGVDGEGAASGLAFTMEGAVPVVIPAAKPEEPFPTTAPAGVNANDWEAFQKFRATETAAPTAPSAVSAAPADNPSPQPATTAPTFDGPATTSTPETSPPNVESVPPDTTPTAQDTAGVTTGANSAQEGE